MKWAKEYRQSHLENKFKRVFRNMKVYYIHGSAGCGKTRYVFKKHGYDDVYRTTNYEFGWIDDYNGEKVLFLDEFRSSFKISEILDYLDGQPIRIRGRHYNRVACYDTVYIVSNLSLQKQYINIQQNEPKTWAAFCRRITAVYNFDESKEIPVNKMICTPKVRQTFGGAYFYEKKEGMEHKILARIQNICYNGYARTPFRLPRNCT